MFKKLFRDESGITALETAIILIAFVVVASVFAFTILSAGTFSTEKGREAIYAGLEQVSSSMEVYGSVVGSKDGSSNHIKMITFTLAAVAGGEGINVTGTTGTGNVLLISYIDDSNYVQNVTFDTTWLKRGDSDDLLESNELAQIDIDISSYQLGPAKDFRVEVKPPSGGVLPIMRTTPASLDSVMVLD